MQGPAATSTDRPDLHTVTWTVSPPATADRDTETVEIGPRRDLRHKPTFLVAVLLVLAAVAGYLDGRHGVDRSPTKPTWETGSSALADARHSRLTDGPGITSYPWSDESDPRAADPWGYVKRQCPSFIAWYLNSHQVAFAGHTQGPAGVGRFDQPADWAEAARAAGFVVSATPVVSSIAQWEPGDAWLPDVRSSPTDRVGGHGAVALVLTVHPDDNSVDVAHYDGKTRQLEIRHARAPRYLYIGVA